MVEDEQNETRNTVSTNNAGDESSTVTRTTSGSAQALDLGSGRGLLIPIFRGLSWGAGVAGAFAIALNAQFGEQIKAYFDNTKKEQYYAATIEQQSNEQKRSNQLIEQLQTALKYIYEDQERARLIASEERQETGRKMDLLLAENKLEKAERLKIKNDLELTTTNVNAVTIELKKCREECLSFKGKK